MREINGNPEAMTAFSRQLTVPPMPPSLARAAIPPNPTGLIEGIAMSLLDKAATVAAAAYLSQVTEELLTYTAKVNTIALGYSAAEVTSAAKLVAASAEFATQSLGLIQQLGGSASPDPAEEPAKTEE